MTIGKNDLGIPAKTFDVSRARSQLTSLLHRLREGPRFFLITQSGKPAGALVNLEWLQALLDQARGRKSFTIFNQAEAAPDWEKTLGQLREHLRTHTLERHFAEK